MGRETELAAIHSLLLGGAQVALDQRAARSGGLTGLGGVGKTTLACEYAHRHLGDYEHICWVNAEGEDPSATFAALADDPLRLGAEAGATVPERVVAVKQHLERATGAVLLVLDNVDHPEGWPQLVPAGPWIRVLVTTRLTDLEGVRRINVDRLPPEKALELLLGSTEAARNPPDSAEELCRELDYLTLALAVAAKILAKGVRTPAMLLAEVRKKGVVPFFDEKGVPKLLGKDSSLRRLFDASVGLLDEADEVDAHAMRMLWVGGWFAAAPIPRDVLFNAAARMAGEAMSDEVGIAALERLVGLGLVQLDVAGLPFLHRVVGAYARARGGETASNAVKETLGFVAWATASEMMALRALAPLASHLAEAARKLDGQSPEWHLCIALKLAQHYRSMARDADCLALCAVLAPSLGETLWASHFYNEGGQALARQGQYSEALGYHQRSLAITEKTLGPEHPVTAITLHAIGQVLASQEKDAEAVDNYRRALVIKESALGPEHPETAITLTALGQALASQGQYAEALEAYVRSLAIKEKTLGPEHPETASVLQSIGQALANQELYAEALAYYRRSLAIQQKTLGSEHPWTANTLHYIGQVLASQGNCAEALDNYQRALVIKEKLLGREHPDTAITLNAIGQALALQGKYAEALVYYERSLAIEEKTLRPEHSSTAISQFELGRCLRDLGKPDGFGRMREACDRLERVLGTEHPKVKAMRSWFR